MFGFYILSSHLSKYSAVGWLDFSCEMSRVGSLQGMFAVTWRLQLPWHTPAHTHTFTVCSPPPTPYPLWTVVVTRTYMHTHTPSSASRSHLLPFSHTPWNSSQAVLPAPAPLGAPSVFSSGLRDLNFLPGEPPPDPHWGQKWEKTEEEPCRSGL